MLSHHPTCLSFKPSFTSLISLLCLSLCSDFIILYTIACITILGGRLVACGKKQRYFYTACRYRRDIIPLNFPPSSMVYFGCRRFYQVL
ncbi:hypothetical protein M8C21_022749 [Ambrosia artemisiifolia]|uniref:Uncharacterized protein n=1 Tax=Ambrosia artemisiifolia TaxID=4212 RepID=A0AAD5GHV9_AMBAR|nr:hypothetical protein M8C21_022749 [Ambrosia artemisiifolia]